MHFDEERQAPARAPDRLTRTAQHVEFGPFHVDLDEVGRQPPARAELIDRRDLHIHGRAGDRQQLDAVPLTPTDDPWAIEGVCLRLVPRS